MIWQSFRKYDAMFQVCGVGRGIHVNIMSTWKQQRMMSFHTIKMARFPYSNWFLQVETTACNSLVKLARDLTRPIFPPNGGLVIGIPWIFREIQVGEIL